MTEAALNFAPLKESFSIQLRMESDWHVGAGAGRPGDLDRLVLRDEAELPYVPAKTLTGIWRDACERVALGLDNGALHLGEKGEIAGWSAWVGYLFGEQAGHPQEDRPALTPEQAATVNRHLVSPRPAALSVRSAHLPDELRRAIRRKPAIRDAATFAKPGIGISSRSGRTKTDFLRFEEMARAGAVLTAECHLDLHQCDDEQKRAATALLLAGARLVERIGGKRRRGAGRCELTVVERREIDDALDWVQAQAAPPAPPPIDSAVDAVPLASTGNGAWTRFELVLTTKTPIIIATRTIGNLIESTDYIPGSYLLALISQCLRRSEIDHAIVNRDLMVTNAAIEIEGQAGRPVPFCLFQDKLGDGLAGRDAALDIVYNRFFERAEEQRQLKGYRLGYIGKTTGGVLPAYQKVKRVVEMHNVIADQVQRPTEGVGGIFSYQAIGAAATFRAELYMRSTLLDAIRQADPDWRARLAGEHRLGRSKKDDFGRIALEVIEPDEMETATQAVEDRFKALPGNLLVVWLLSDLLLRDERLRPVASIEALRKKLAKELQVGLTVREDQTTALLSKLSRSSRVDSWHFKWQLPRPSLVGLAAGTCAVFQVDGSLDSQVLARIEQEGLGERCVEGYGRLRFNDPAVAAACLKSERKDKQKEEKAGVQSDESHVSSPEIVPYARLLEREALRREIGRRAIRFAGEEREKLGMKVELVNGTMTSKPPMSQLSGLRSALGRLQGRTDADKDSALFWIKALEETKNRLQKWTSENGKLVHLHELVSNEHRVWELLGLGDWSKLCITQTGAHELKSDLWAEAVRTLVDACVRAQKRATEKTEGDNGATN